MPLDSPIQKLSIVQADFAATLIQYFRDHTFTADRAALMTNRTRTSAATLLSLLVSHGAAYRVKYGVYSMDAPNPERAVAAFRPAALPKPVEIVEREPVAPGPIKDLPHALAWLTKFGIRVVPTRDIYTVDDRCRATAEQVIAIAERRRTNRERYPDLPVRRFGDLETKIPEPTAAQRMVKR